MVGNEVFWGGMCIFTQHLVENSEKALNNFLFTIFHGKHTFHQLAYSTKTQYHFYHLAYSRKTQYHFHDLAYIRKPNFISIVSPIVENPISFPSSDL